MTILKNLSFLLAVALLFSSWNSSGTLALVSLPQAIAQSKSEAPFLPTWKLLSKQQKKDFLAGYLHAWSDAGHVLDIAIGYVEQNPENAAAALEQLKGLYNFEGISPEAAEREVDQFFTQADNSTAPLSRAVSSMRKSSGGARR